MNAAKTINVWDAKDAQDKLGEVTSRLMELGFRDEALEMLKAFDKVLDAVVE
jgi:hypothetical protein